MQTAMLGLSFGRNDEKAASRVMRLAPSRPYDKPVISECTLYVLQANRRANDWPTARENDDSLIRLSRQTLASGSNGFR